MSTKIPTAHRRGGSESVFEQLHDVMFLFRTKVMQASRDDAAGVAGMEFRALHFFARHPGATQVDLVRHSGRDKGQIARLVRILTDRDWVRRNPDATRPSGLWVTERGALAHTQFQTHRQRIAKEYVRVLSAAEQSQLHDLLQKLKDALGDSSH